MGSQHPLQQQHSRRVHAAIAQQVVARIAAESAAHKRIRECGTYAELEALAGITDRAAFWAPFAQDGRAACEALQALAFDRLMAGERA